MSECYKRVKVEYNNNKLQFICLIAIYRPLQNVSGMRYSDRTFLTIPHTINNTQ